MKSLNTLANKVLENYPVTRDYLKKVIAVESAHRSTSLAIERLLEIIESQQKELTIGSRIRKFRPCWISVLVRLAFLTVNRYESKQSLEIPRKDFLDDISANDFSLMKHWGLIAQHSGGKWSITRKGIGFVLCKPGYRYIKDSILQVGGVKDCYSENDKAGHIHIYDFGIMSPLSNATKTILERIFDAMPEV